jgi:hypothetical protein
LLPNKKRRPRERLLDSVYEFLYNSSMAQDKYQVLRIWKQTHHTLRKIAAFTGESLVQVLERMAKEEWQRVQQRGEHKRAPVQENQT